MRLLKCTVAVAVLLGATACSNSRNPSGASVLGVVAFDTRTDLSAEVTRVADIVFADLDGDGVLDLVVSSLNNSISVLIGNGSGGFVVLQEIVVAGTPIKMAHGDVDGDGDADLAVIRANDQQVSVFLNDGTGNLALSDDLVVGVFPSAVVIGDVDGDGVADVCVGHLSAAGLITFAGAGDGTFGAPAPIVLPASSAPAGLALADVDRDGVPDLLITDKNNARLLIMRGAVGGPLALAFTLPVGDAPLAVAAGDLNADGLVDVAVGNLASGDVTVLLSDGANFTPSTVDVAGAPGHILIADVTSDGLTDLVACVFDRAAVSVFSGQPTGLLGAEVQLSASGSPISATAGDVDGDGRTDLLVAGGEDTVSIFRGVAVRGLAGAVNYDTGIPTPEFVASADLDGDGRAEIAVVGRGHTSVSILKLVDDPSGRPTAQVVLSVPVGRKCFNVVSGDFDSDGRVDLAVSTDRGVKILANGSAGGALALSPVPANPNEVLAPGAGPFEIAPVDLDGDGFLDMVVTDAFAQTLTVLRSMGPGFDYSPVPVTLPVGGTPIGLAVGDFTGDLRPDVAVSRFGAAAVSIFRNDGNGGLVPWREITVGAGPNYLRTSDFDRDGRADLVVSNATTNSVTVLFARPGGFGSLAIPAGEAPTALAARDLNRDGRSDILVANLAGSDFRVLLGDGSGGFPVRLTFPGTYKATSAALADVNGNGLLDLIIASLDTSRVSVYENISK